ncbi:CDP-diacylglycerol--glycerol-3-phosphate 3-phosphatidyltransferase [bacterium]|nr:CDP-diacylglycerol--glycerol-3-phosphate 3-phosphatidyltransferase [bacterium]
MNLPNKLTVCRLAMPLVVMPCLLKDFPYSKTLALAFFALASITDFLDGHIARKHNLVTDFGKLMDPLADKILVCSVLICFTAMYWKNGIVAPWMVVAIVGRDLVVTGLRMAGLSRGAVLGAHAIGKHKTAWQMIAIVTMLFYLVFSNDLNLSGSYLEYFRIATHILFWFVSLLTIFSGFYYLVKYKNFYLDNA